ncbi:MAG: hypothetical protein GW748_01860 [Alphaproteobacteria bacterium]|nr:hypothetical protein [Alphaproteobacteria bacterium]NCQ66476.1 hypothetical protein [Alphaproteobacteria bacterium]
MTQDLKETNVTALKEEKIHKLTGSKFSGFTQNLVNQMMQSLNLQGISEKDALVSGESFLDALEALGPKNEIEGMLITQLVATHNAAMECFKRAANPNYSFEEQQKSLGGANKLVRSYAALVESIERGRGKGGNEQKITVQHIHINDKAQAIVGDVGRG